MSGSSLVPGAVTPQLTAGLQRADLAVPSGHRYARDGLEFGRVVNLADAVFAIALTLLVLTLDAPDVGALVTFALAFFLVASVWWQHHRIIAQLAWFEPGLIAVNLVLLAGVALAPFPTSLVSAAPGSRGAVLAFIGLFALLSALCLTLIVRTHRLGAWRRRLPVRLYRWVVLDWTSNLAVHLACLAIAVWAPLAALVCLVLGALVTSFTVHRLGPPERRAWC